MDTLVTHLIELRARLLRTVIFFCVALGVGFYFSSPLFLILVRPLLNVLPQGETLIATHLMSPVLTPIQLAVDIALLVTAPVLLYQVWRFIMPGLYPHERQTARGVMMTSLFLFMLGACFAFYLVLPSMLHLLVHATPPGVRFLPEMNQALDFITHMLSLFGFCFQIPLLCRVAVHLGWIKLHTLKSIRPYVVVAAFTLGMLLTPPDVLSQVMLAIPLWLLYELGILIAGYQHSQT